MSKARSCFFFSSSSRCFVSSFLLCSHCSFTNWRLSSSSSFRLSCSQFQRFFSFFFSYRSYCFCFFRIFFSSFISSYVKSDFHNLVQLLETLDFFKTDDFLSMFSCLQISLISIILDSFISFSSSTVCQRVCLLSFFALFLFSLSLMMSQTSSFCFLTSMVRFSISLPISSITLSAISFASYLFSRVDLLISEENNDINKQKKNIIRDLRGVRCHLKIRRDLGGEGNVRSLDWGEFLSKMMEFQEKMRGSWISCFPSGRLSLLRFILLKMSVFVKVDLNFSLIRQRTQAPIFFRLLRSGLYSRSSDIHTLLARFRRLLSCSSFFKPFTISKALNLTQNLESVFFGDKAVSEYCCIKSWLLMFWVCCFKVQKKDVLSFSFSSLLALTGLAQFELIFEFFLATSKDQMSVKQGEMLKGFWVSFLMALKIFQLLKFAYGISPLSQPSVFSLLILSFLKVCCKISLLPPNLILLNCFRCSVSSLFLMTLICGRASTVFFLFRIFVSLMVSSLIQFQLAHPQIISSLFLCIIISIQNYQL